jgi:hypothetical protein
MFLFVLLGLVASLSVCMDTHHFYRASFLPHEPRFERPWLFTTEVLVASGTTSTSFDKCRNSRPLFDLYGPQQAQLIGAGIPLNPANGYEALMLNVLDLPRSPTFGNVSFTGCFRLHEVRINVFQNFKYGFFGRVAIPVRDFFLEGIHYKDCSNLDDLTQEQRQTWHSYLLQLPQILAHFGVALAPYHYAHIGDISLLLGWTINYQNTEYLDYLDGTIQLGVMTPSSPLQNINSVFSLPAGYNGHTGIPLVADWALGAGEWFTFGIHGDILWLLPHLRTVRIKTNEDQNGFIKLGLARVEEDPGILGSVSTYAHANHFYGGLSVLLGYTFAGQRSTIYQCPQSFLDTQFVNTDSMLHNWHMHTLHIWIEYDFETECNPYLPRIAFLYNFLIKGKRVFDNSMSGAQWAVDFVWRY